MSQRFAVKLGEVYLVADRPITPGERDRALRQVKKFDRVLVQTDDGTEMWATEFKPQSP